MIRTLTTNEIAINATVEKVATEAEVVNVPFLKHVIEKSAEVLSGLFLKCMIEI